MRARLTHRKGPCSSVRCLVLASRHASLMGDGPGLVWLMELSMANRRAITKARAMRYRSGSRAVSRRSWTRCVQ